MATKTRVRGARPPAPRLMSTSEGLLICESTPLRELPPGGTLGFCCGLLAVRFATKRGPMAILVCDLPWMDVRRILEAQRREASAHLGPEYSEEATWWGKV